VRNGSEIIPASLDFLESGIDNRELASSGVGRLEVTRVHEEGSMQGVEDGFGEIGAISGEDLAGRRDDTGDGKTGIATDTDLGISTLA